MIKDEKIIHPKDPNLVFPYVYSELRDPNTLVAELFDEFFNNKQEYDDKKNILYRKYEKYWKLDSISCFFTEKVRLYCTINGYPNLVQTWKSLDPKIIKTFQNVDQARTELLYKYKGKECNLFTPALALRMILGFNSSRYPVKVIDPSSGWGDRAIAAIAAGDLVSEYTGFDPNKDLIVPYRNLKSTLDLTNKCEFICQKFEEASPKKSYYDVGITSPPYFTLEVYSDDASQSISGERQNYEGWLRLFYRKYIENLCSAVKDTGVIGIYVSDFFSKGKVYDLEHQTLKFMSENGWEVSVRGELWNSKLRPFFMFRKKN